MLPFSQNHINIRKQVAVRAQDRVRIVKVPSAKQAAQTPDGEKGA